jgi:hypothetical protein
MRLFSQLLSREVWSSCRSVNTSNILFSLKWENAPMLCGFFDLNKFFNVTFDA